MSQSFAKRLQRREEASQKKAIKKARKKWRRAQLVKQTGVDTKSA